ncbi:hypothetical protein N9N28_09025 [Rubripirellula amarantea]|nr:hypothetical protein [Rubripirellula amarantea]
MRDLVAPESTSSLCRLIALAYAERVQSRPVPKANAEHSIQGWSGLSAMHDVVDAKRSVRPKFQLVDIRSNPAKFVSLGGLREEPGSTKLAKLRYPTPPSAPFQMESPQ